MLVTIYNTTLVLYGHETSTHTLREPVREQGAEGNIWAHKKRSDGRTEKITK
jgi:hypothetical protein